MSKFLRFSILKIADCSHTGHAKQNNLRSAARFTVGKHTSQYFVHDFYFQCPPAEVLEELVSQVKLSTYSQISGITYLLMSALEKLTNRGLNRLIIDTIPIITWTLIQLQSPLTCFYWICDSFCEFCKFRQSDFVDHRIHLKPVKICSISVCSQSRPSHKLGDAG